MKKLIRYVISYPTPPKSAVLSLAALITVRTTCNTVLLLNYAKCLFLSSTFSIAD